MAKKTNKEVLIQINQSRSLLTIIKKFHFKFFGHIRSKQPEHLAICAKNAWGCPRKMYLFKHSIYLAASYDRKRWKIACALVFMLGSGNGPL